MWSTAFDLVAMKFHPAPPDTSRHQRLCPICKQVRGCWQFKRNVPDDNRQNVIILLRRQTLLFAGFSVGRSATIQTGQEGCDPQWCDASPDMEVVRHFHLQLGHAHGWIRHDTQIATPISPRHQGQNMDMAADQAVGSGWRSGPLWGHSRYSTHALLPSYCAQQQLQPRQPHSPYRFVSANQTQEDGTCHSHIQTTCLAEHAAPRPGVFGNQGLIADKVDKQFNYVRPLTAYCSTWPSRQKQSVSIGGIL